MSISYFSDEDVLFRDDEQPAPFSDEKEHVEMALRTFIWASRLRGFPTPTHFAVAHILANETGARSEIVVPMLRHGRIAEILGCSSMTARRCVYDFIKWKIIKERKAKFFPSMKATRGSQTANYYELNLEQFSPPDPHTGPLFWKLICKAFLPDAPFADYPDLVKQFEVYAADCKTFFDFKRQWLFIWPDQGSAFKFLRNYALPLLLTAKKLEDPTTGRLKPSVKRIEIVA